MVILKNRILFDQSFHFFIEIVNGHVQSLILNICLKKHYKCYEIQLMHIPPNIFLGGQSDRDSFI